MKSKLILLLLIFGSTFALAQNKESSRDSEKKIDRDKAAAYSYGAENVKNRKQKKSKVKYSLYKDFDKKVEEFEERMKANTKKYKKMEKEMEKPQYSDPTYFGHKRPPKKRPPGKKKYCKECGMVH